MVFANQASLANNHNNENNVSSVNNGPTTDTASVFSLTLDPQNPNNGTANTISPTPPHTRHPFIIKHANVELFFLVPSNLLFPFERYRDGLLRHLIESSSDTQHGVTETQLDESGGPTLSAQKALKNTPNGGRSGSGSDAERAEMKLFSTLMIYIFKHVAALSSFPHPFPLSDVQPVLLESASSPNFGSSVEILTMVVKSFEQRFLKHSNNVHAVVYEILNNGSDDKHERNCVISAYVACCRLLEDCGLKTSMMGLVLKPDLVRQTLQKRASLLGVFGGQGNTEVYFDELVELYQTYAPVLGDIIPRMARDLKDMVKDAEVLALHSKGLDVELWLRNEDARPDNEYLLSAPVSLPLIGLAQLLHYYLFSLQTGLSLKVIQSLFKDVGVTGHSQGIVTAVVVASSEDDESFFENSRRGINLLFWIGTRAQQCSPLSTINPTILRDSIEHFEGVPSPLFAIQNLGMKEVAAHVEAVNRHLPQGRKIEIALHNGPRSVVCAGPPQSLYGLAVRVRKSKVHAGKVGKDEADMARTPFSKRKLKFTTKFLPVTAPFHCSYLQEVASSVLPDDIRRWKLAFDVDQIAVPVYSTENGKDIRQILKHTELTQSKDLLERHEHSLRVTLYLVDQICSLNVDWSKATSVNATHLVDFGPGGTSGVGMLTHRNKEGTGTMIILANTFLPPTSDLLGRASLFNTRKMSLRFSPNWKELYRPRLVRTDFDGKVKVETRMSRFLGKPHLMVAGMTPTTVNEHIVSATINAGYHIELAGGGHYNEKALRTKIDRILGRIKPGEGVSINILFLNARQWGFQYPLVQKMRKEGYPIDGVCVAAGVPSIEVANEVIRSLKGSGIRHVSFKPGSVDAIRRVVRIAKENRDMPVMLQWTGGRAGGHHSFEDFHQPLLETYSSIRKQPNLILVVGSGFGDGEGTLPYLTGDWSVRFDYSPMPVDGILFGSRMLVAKESLAHDKMKQLLVDAPGIDNEKDWEGTFEAPTGGVITVVSELGEPIHKVATRGIKLWKEFDDTIFKLPKQKQLEVLERKKHYIIDRLNQDFQKVWFPRHLNGETHIDVNDMSYYEVAQRLGELLYIKKHAMWINQGYKELVWEFLRRTEERLSDAASVTTKKSVLPDDWRDLGDDEDPQTFLDNQFFPAYPTMKSHLLTTQDVLFFNQICSKRGRKPVPFIPFLDANFSTWFKKDSLWQSEFLEAVVDEDPQRCCMLQGPVAVKHSTKVNEPIQEILDGINEFHIEEIEKLLYAQERPTTSPTAASASKDSIPSVARLFDGYDAGDTRPSEDCEFKNVVRHVSSNMDERATTQYTIVPMDPKTVPDEPEWFRALTSGIPCTEWLKAVLQTPIIARGHYYHANPLIYILRPKQGRKICLKQFDSTVPQEDESIGGAAVAAVPRQQLVVQDDGDTLIEVDLTQGGKRLDFRFVASVDAYKEGRDPLVLLFDFKPEQPYCPVHEVMEGRDERIKEFYAGLWLKTTRKVDHTTDKTCDIEITEESLVDPKAVRRFCKVIGNTSEEYMNSAVAPMDFGIVIAWRALMRTLFVEGVRGDLMRLVHLNTGFRMLKGNASKRLRCGSKVKTTASIQSILNTQSGKQVSVRAVIRCSESNEDLLEVTSSFLIRGTFEDYENTFKKSTEDPVQVMLSTKKDVAVLRSKQWVRWNEGLANKCLNPGCVLEFRLSTFAEYQAEDVTSVLVTKGTVTTRLPTQEVVELGDVDFEYHGQAVGNPVTEYLKRVGTLLEQPVMFEDGGYRIKTEETTFQAPASNMAYGRVSGDSNPIHVNQFIAHMAGLPGTITHGMWTSAATRKYVEIFAADNVPSRVVSYHVSFVDMVLPGDKLTTTLSHLGMTNGRKIIQVTTTNASDNTVVLRGTAEVEQPTMAYIFTGQGSQEKGMGMALYETSPVARAIWDRADRHFLNTYGFSILDIVRRNPLTKTVYFGGEQGREIRQNYIDKTYDILDEVTGKLTSKPLFPEVTPESDSYTFKSPTGLLGATQFTQPALTLVEKAAFEDMKSKGLAQENCPFAGHSLGEYAALASVGDVLPVESLVDVVFYRGMTMQRAVPRDAANRSNYGMVAANPGRVHRSFGQEGLELVVAKIARIEQGLLEIVNYNVDGQQYVVAGDLASLDALANVLNYLRTLQMDFKALRGQIGAEALGQKLVEIVKGAVETVQRKRSERSGPLELERGFATIPLKGIDVPFHSSFLLPGVATFREYLKKMILPQFVNPTLLVGRYIPNLTAKKFDISADYVQEVFELTKSTALASILAADLAKPQTAASIQKISHCLLIELLAYQFASPVQWIETQDVLLRDSGVTRMIEVGPAPILTGMAERTLMQKYKDYDDALTYRRQNLCYEKDADKIYYKEDRDSAVDDLQEPSEQTKHESLAVTRPSQPPVSTPQSAVQPPTPPPVATAAGLVDYPSLTAKHVVKVIICQKLRKPLQSINMTETIKDLVGGKSTLQNEILGDLQKEFGSASFPEKAEEAPLDEVAGHLEPTYGGTLGPHTTPLVSKLITGKMPAGFSLTSAKGYLGKSFGMEGSFADAVLLTGLTMEPSSRLVAVEQVHPWLDEVAGVCAASHAVSLSRPSQTGGSSGAQALGVNSEEYEQFVESYKSLLKRQLNVLAQHANLDTWKDGTTAASLRSAAETLQEDLDLWLSEHGEFYANAIKPLFTPLKARAFESSWNWVTQDVLALYYDVVFGRLKIVDRQVTSKCIHVMNRADDKLLSFLQFLKKCCDEKEGEGYRRAKELGSLLIENCEIAFNTNPVYKLVDYPMAPKTSIDEDGKIVYEEVYREGMRSVHGYVKEMREGSRLLRMSGNDEAQATLNQLRDYLMKEKGMDKASEALKIMALLERNVAATGFVKQGTDDSNLPYICIKQRLPVTPTHWQFSNVKTQQLFSVMTDMAENGLSLTGKTVLLTGCGKGSIGAEILKALLSAGAKVVATTSSFRKEMTEFYRAIYEQHGSKGSCLVVVPFNQGSSSDVKNLVQFIYSSSASSQAAGGDVTSSLGWDLDFIIPFAAISENGRTISELDSRSEFAHRLMLTNLIRIMGAVKAAKEERSILTRPAQVILPMSPNKGTIGQDGLYGESKIALESLFNRWHSEDWGQYLCVAGAVIGWTRGTGLMTEMDLIAGAVEQAGMRTFSQQEMAFNILSLMDRRIVDLSQREPVYADFTGGMDLVSNISELLTGMRKAVNEKSTIRRAVKVDEDKDKAALLGRKSSGVAGSLGGKGIITPRAGIKSYFPKIRPYHELEKLSAAKGMLDRDRIVVVTGYGEVGPYGSSRTRWEMEARGKFSLEGCIEMAWMMGLIRHHNGPLKSLGGQPYCGWVDATTEEPSPDWQVKEKYEAQILSHTGIRLVDPELFDNYDPNNKGFMQEIVVNHDLESMETTEEEAMAFKRFHGDAVDVLESPERDGRYHVRVKKGATLYIPKALRFDRLVAGQIPKGWDHKRYGLSDDLAGQVDAVTLYTLVSTMEALVASGITNPYEFYKYVHVSEVGNTIGSGIGGVHKLRNMFKHRHLEHPLQSDIMAESFINSMGAWVNMLLLSSSGPVKTPVGACATAVESLEMGVESILCNKAKVVVMGAVDDYGEESAYEFAQLRATSNSIKELAHGREPKEMSRPAASTRGGFMESHGAGHAILMSLSTAVEMGVPVYGVVAFTQTATDKQGSSLPAPGKGVLTTARETPGRFADPMLDIEYRRRQLKLVFKHIASWTREEMEELEAQARTMREEMRSEEDTRAFVMERQEFIQRESAKQYKDAQWRWGNNFFVNNPRIAPLRGALAAWGLTVDDIGLVSCHGTGTKANDLNEPQVINKQFEHLGRTSGNLCPAICQKYLTGHPKGPAAAWMMNGVLQALDSAIVPGNRNADNIDPKLREYKHIFYPSRSQQYDCLKAGLMKSFGFGQAGGEVLLLHSDYALSLLEKHEYDSYLAKLGKRNLEVTRYWNDTMANVRGFVNSKSAPPYSETLEQPVYLDPTARVGDAPNYTFESTKSKVGEYHSTAGQDHDRLLERISLTRTHRGIGIDVQLLEDIHVDNEAFIARNFTAAERSYCDSRPDPRSSYAGKWAAKEAVVKAITSFLLDEDGTMGGTAFFDQGAGASLIDIEILNHEVSGVPRVALNGYVGERLKEVAIGDIKVSISHDGAYAVAICHAT